MSPLARLPWWMEHMLRAHRTTLLEFAVAATALFSGAWVLLGIQTFTDATLLSALPPRLVGLLFVAHGGLHIGVLMWPIGERRSARNLGQCRRGALASMWFWAAVAVSYWPGLGTGTTLAAPLCICLALWSAWAWLRLRYVEREQEHQAAHEKEVPAWS